MAHVSVGLEDIAVAHDSVGLVDIQLWTVVVWDLWTYNCVSW